MNSYDAKVSINGTQVFTAEALDEINKENKIIRSAAFVFENQTPESERGKLTDEAFDIPADYIQSMLHTMISSGANRIRFTASGSRKLMGKDFILTIKDHREYSPRRQWLIRLAEKLLDFVSN